MAPCPCDMTLRMWQDFRYALRTMLASPGFTAVAVLSLALGIGADTAIFTLWNDVLRAPLPGVRDPERLVVLSNPDESGSWTGRTDGRRSWLTYEEFEQLRDHAPEFEAMMASQSSLNTWPVRFEDGAAEEASGRLVSGGFFQVLGVGPAMGRLFTAADDRSDAPHAVISHAYWQRRFGGRSDVLGRTVIVRKTPITIIGVAAAGFIGETTGQQPDLWLPLRLQPAVLPGRDRLHDTPPEKAMWLHIFARLKPGVTFGQAEARANAIFQAGLESFYGVAATGDRRRELLNQRLQIGSAARGASRARTRFSDSLTALLGAVGVLLLIACANLANLLLARGAARQPEIALRFSLGASRGRLIRQLVTESLTLAVMGGVAAVPVAYMFHDALVAMMAKSDPSFRMTFGVNPTVVGFMCAATVGTALLFGVLPAWRATRGDAAAGLKQQSRGASGAFGQRRSGRFLVSMQLALSLPLLVGAGLLMRTVYNLQHADLGFPTERLLLVRVNLREAGYAGPRLDRVVGELTAAIRRIPGVQAASYSQLGLFTGGESSSGIVVEGYVPRGDLDRESAFDRVGPGYFAALATPIRLGRDIREDDPRRVPPACVINEAFAKLFFAQQNPIGKRVTMGSEDGGTSYEVVGVAANARTQDLRDDVVPRFYIAAGATTSEVSSPTFLIRSTTATGAGLASVRTAIQSVDAALPIMSAKSLAEQLAPLIAQDRATAQLAVVFGCVALALAAIGLYGVLSYAVARRTGEIAIRLALGAEPRGVVSMILRETLVVVAVGLGLGAVISYAGSRWIESRLYGVAAQDPVTAALATLLLLMVAFGAAYVPARRASGVDPMTALRQ